MFLPHDRVFESSLGRSTRLVDVVPQTATIRKDLCTLTQDRTLTMFNEVRRVPPEEAWTQVKRKQVRKVTFLNATFKAFLKAIADNWKPEKFHLVLHSAGYDSRILSTGIKTLYMKKGADWLGKVLFAEVNEESEPFKEIMQVEGWSENQYAVVPRADSLDFKNAWKHLNGISNYPVNFWQEPIEWLQEHGLAPSDEGLQCWSALGGTESVGALTKGIAWLLSYLYWGCDTYTMPLKSEWVFPFQSLNFLQTLRKYGLKQAPQYRPMLLERFAPKLQKTVPHYQAPYYWKLSETALAQLRKDYAASWYGRMVAPDTPQEEYVCFSWYWVHWSTASFCEHLRETGHDIKVGE